MATLSPDYTMDNRKSAETDRRRLLSESVAPSESASMVDYGDGDKTPRASSPARRGTIADPTTVPRPYRGFPSEAHYLAALQAWAESKKYVESDMMLHGFYGPKTIEEYASQPGVELGLRKKWRQRKEKKAEKQAERRNTVA